MSCWHERRQFFSTDLCSSSPCSADGIVRHASLWLWSSRNVSPPFRYPRISTTDIRQSLVTFYCIIETGHLLAITGIRTWVIIIAQMICFIVMTGTALETFTQWMEKRIVFFFWNEVALFTWQQWTCFLFMFVINLRKDTNL